MLMKKSNDTIGNQTRDLPVCSALSQPTAPPRAPKLILVYQLIIAQILNNLYIITELS
jgi:hypothetical protein